MVVAANDNDINHTYVGETKRPLSVRFKEHCKLDKTTAVGEHCLETGHSVSLTNTKVLAREEDWFKRKIKEAINIRQQQPSINRDQGYHLPAIYSQILPPISEFRHHDQNNIITWPRSIVDGSKRRDRFKQCSKVS